MGDRKFAANRMQCGPGVTSGTAAAPEGSAQSEYGPMGRSQSVAVLKDRTNAPLAAAPCTPSIKRLEVDVGLLSKTPHQATPSATAPRTSRKPRRTAGRNPGAQELDEDAAPIATIPVLAAEGAVPPSTVRTGRRSGRIGPTQVGLNTELGKKSVSFLSPSAAEIGASRALTTPVPDIPGPFVKHAAAQQTALKKDADVEGTARRRKVGFEPTTTQSAACAVPKTPSTSTRRRTAGRVGTSSEGLPKTPFPSRDVQADFNGGGGKAKTPFVLRRGSADEIDQLGARLRAIGLGESAEVPNQAQAAHNSDPHGRALHHASLLPVTRPCLLMFSV
jgi:hypothetical protein